MAFEMRWESSSKNLGGIWIFEGFRLGEVSQTRESWDLIVVFLEELDEKISLIALFLLHFN